MSPTPPRYWPPRYGERAPEGPKPPEPKDCTDGRLPGHIILDPTQRRAWRERGLDNGGLLLWLFALATLGIVAAVSRSMP